MSLTTRLLPPELWNEQFGALPAHSRVIVVEDGDAEVGRWVLMPVWHAEFLQIAPAYQGKTSVARRLWYAMTQTAKSLGVKAVYTGAMDPGVCRLLAHVGATKLPGEHFIWEIDPCRQP